MFRVMKMELSQAMCLNAYSDVDFTVSGVYLIWQILRKDWITACLNLASKQ